MAAPAPKKKPKARVETYFSICAECWKSLDEDTHATSWRYNRTKDPCEHCMDDNPRLFRIKIPEGLKVIL